MFNDGSATGSHPVSPSIGHPPAPVVNDPHDEDAPTEGHQGLATGSERSGMSVDSPNRQTACDLLKRAAESPMPGESSGSGKVESTHIPDPNASGSNEGGVIRYLTFWRDGFSVGDGPLMRYEDPQQAAVLSQINSGFAPPTLFNVLPGQPVEVRVASRLDEDYVAPVREVAPVVSEGSAGASLGAGTRGTGTTHGGDASSRVHQRKRPTVGDAERDAQDA
ncbi:SEP domain-containing protein [Mycena sp. CBHHK59/15]|nr:SEP domain-containing protein [Mycena sp. CBHHK59/15]